MRQLRAVVVLLIGVALPRVAVAQPLAYVTNHSTNTVHVFRTDDWSPVTTIPVGLAPAGITIASDGSFAYVANHGNDTVSRIDLATNTVTATIPVSGGPTSVAITPDTLTAYVVQSSSCPVLSPVVTPTPGPTPTADPTPTPVGNPTPVPCTVAVIDTASNTVISTITVGPFPFAVAMSQSGGFAYVTNSGDATHPGSISVIDARSASPTWNTVVTNVAENTIGLKPEGIAVGAGKIFLTNDAANNVTVVREFDLQVVGTIRAGGGPFGVAVSPDNSLAVVSNDRVGKASVVNLSTNHVIESIAVGASPAGVAVLPDSQHAVIANSSGNSISVIPLLSGQPTLTVPIFGSPTAVAITPSASFRLWMVGFPNPVQEAGQVTFTLVYANAGSAPSAAATLTSSVPDELTFVSATGGVLQPTVPATVTWPIAALPVGGSASVQVAFSVNSPLPFGTLIKESATLDDAAGHTATATDSVVVIPEGVRNLTINLARLNVSTLPTPRDNLRLKGRFTPSASAPFDPLQPLSLLIATGDQQILRLDVPSNAFVANRPRTIFRYRFNEQPGEKWTVTVRPRGPFGEYQIVVTVSRATFTHPDSTAMSIAVIAGTVTYETIERFNTRQFGATRVQYSLP